MVGLGGIGPPTSALSVLRSSLFDAALTRGFVAPSLCCCTLVPHTCQIGQSLGNRSCQPCPFQASDLLADGQGATDSDKLH